MATTNNTYDQRIEETMFKVFKAYNPTENQVKFAAKEAGFKGDHWDILGIKGI